MVKKTTNFIAGNVCLIFLCVFKASSSHKDQISISTKVHRSDAHLLTYTNLCKSSFSHPFHSNPEPRFIRSIIPSFFFALFFFILR